MGFLSLVLIVAEMGWVGSLLEPRRESCIIFPPAAGCDQYLHGSVIALSVWGMWSVTITVFIR